MRADALMRVVPVGTTVLNAADLSLSAVDFDRHTIKAILIYSDDGDGPRVGRIIHGPDLLLKDGFWQAR